jgi:magnesium chelatase family protein
MNPCPCGNLLNEQKECRCSELEIQRYKNRLSDPFLDRIDLCVVMQQVRSNDKVTISSKEMHSQVIDVHKKARLRGQRRFTAKLSDEEIEKYCVLDSEAKDVLERAVERFALSFRSIKKIQKVSRTIADLDASDIIGKKHLLEALSYRRRS